MWDGNGAQVANYIAQGPVTYAIAMNGSVYGAAWGVDRSSFAVVDPAGIIQYISSNGVHLTQRYEASKAELLATLDHLTMTSGVDRPGDGRPASFLLEQNFPNPFHTETSITFTVPLQQTTTVRLTIYNLLGQEVRTLVNEHLAAGEHRRLWDGRDAKGRLVQSGVYFYKLEAGQTVAFKRLVRLE